MDDNNDFAAGNDASAYADTYKVMILLQMARERTASWAVLAVFWAILSHLGPFCNALLPSWRHVRALRGCFRGILANLRASCTVLCVCVRVHPCVCVCVFSVCVPCAWFCVRVDPGSSRPAQGEEPPGTEERRKKGAAADGEQEWRPHTGATALSTTSTSVIPLSHPIP